MTTGSEQRRSAAEVKAIWGELAGLLRAPIPVPELPLPHWTPEGSLAQRLEEAAVGWEVDANRYLGDRRHWRALRAAALWEAAGRARS